MGLGIFDLTGGSFLMVYAGLLAITIVAGFAIPRWLRPEGRRVQPGDPDEIAYLAGGAPRYVDTVVAQLLAKGKIAVEGRSRARIISPPVLASGPERSILALSSPAPWAKVMKAASEHARSIEDRLVRADLLIDRGTTIQLRCWQTAPYLALLLLGAVKWDIGSGRGHPVGYLTALMVITAVLALIRFASVDRRTRGGMEALAGIRSNADRLRRADIR